MRLALLGCALALVAGCSTEPAPTLPPAVDAVAVSGSNAEVSSLVRLSGTVRARNETELSFRVSGLLVARPAGLGSVVKAGEVLAELDTADLQSAAGAAAASARSAEQDAQAARAAAALATAEEQRLRGLDAAGAISPLAYERARDQAAVLTQQAGAASSRAQALKAQADLAANQARYAQLRAPTNGVVLEVLAESGQVLQPGMPVLRFAREGDREIEVFLPEAELAAARETAHVLLPTSPTPLPAQLREVAGAPDPATRTYRARFRLTEAPAITPALGSTATLALKRKQPTAGLTVPVSAIIWRSGQSSVALINTTNQQVVLRPVEVLQMGSEFSRIRGELASGELLVRSGGHALTAGQTVRVITPQAGS